MKEYICKKNGWKEEQFLMYDWDATEKVLDSYKA